METLIKDGDDWKVVKKGRSRGSMKAEIIEVEITGSGGNLKKASSNKPVPKSGK